MLVQRAVAKNLGGMGREKEGEHLDSADG
ncbi:protein of unknown function [Nitrospira defluvii]|uniref:Uncharacterized protein n=1 Tax=Nitrospira defluvii TaxID=330214 RepID=D8PIZ6_9BACT|nr:protein of unknown function [Nitrospira defluvii]